ncbi:MAG: glycoside hydrolase family 3 C-terminal domain-containing protein [Lachnospiraceae bacterium]|nr:glycoside hydrolase family 3 C-terminal domain-containing protein [Lachnospiraceae bacterium]
MTCINDKTSPFWDNSLTEDERLDWLLSHMTIEEKLGALSSTGADIERLGIPKLSVGGEAAHGVEGRNDQNELGRPDISTSFPQPIGMSATWDVELVKEAGKVTGTEARVIYHRHPDRGLSRWAPTVDLERDPRWGRTEEGYGEDPVLTGKMASAYVRGMRGEDPYYIRCASTLKHFYGNNTEDGRGFKNVSIDPRNKEELYLEPFRRVIIEGGATGVMTAYNKINGIPGILNHEVRDILKKRYGLMHVVGDGGALGLVNYKHHYFGTNGESISAALKAGVDGMSDAPDIVRNAAVQAYVLGLLTEEMMDEALRNTYRLKLRLGVYDKTPANPYDNVSEEDLDTKASRALARKLTAESVVLLQNKERLPLSEEDMEDTVLIGPLADAWYQDWYGGEPPYKKTLRDGIRDVTGRKLPVCEGYDTVNLFLDGKAVKVDTDGTLKATEDKEGDEFVRMDWGEGRITYKHVSTGKFLNCRMDQKKPEEAGIIACEKDAPFDWFVMEIFYEEKEDGKVYLANRFRKKVTVTESGLVRAIVSPDIKGAPSALEIKTLNSGINSAIEAAKSHAHTILALGCCSMIGAKEEIDRKSIALPPVQQQLLEKVLEASDDVVVVLLSNYPYAMKGAEKKAKAVLWCATGSQDMGSGLADVLLGKEAPAGRLNMTWYHSDEDLPDIDDYDIIRGGRTYRYFEGEADYPFGYGLTLAAFRYENLKVSLKDEATILATFDITNDGNIKSDEVVQLYGIPPKSRVKKPLKQLLAFKRVHGVKPGETRQIALEVNVTDLFFYDTISATRMVEEGDYTFFAGRSSADRALSCELFVPGNKPGSRNTNVRIKADHFDDASGVELCEGSFDYTAVSAKDSDKAVITFRDCAADKDVKKILMGFKSDKGCRLEVFIDGKAAAVFEGDTRTYEAEAKFRENSLREGTPMPASWPAVNIEWESPLKSLPEAKEGKTTVEFRITGDVRLNYWMFAK